MSRLLVFRVTAPLLAASCLLLGIAAATAWYVQRLHANLSEVLASNVASMRTAEELEIDLHEVRSRLIRFVLTGEQEHFAAAMVLHGESKQWLDEADRLAVTPHEKRLIARVKENYAHFFDEIAKVSPASREADREKILRLIDRTLTEDILDPVHEYLDLNEELALAAVEDNRTAGNQLVAGLLGLGVCGLAAGGLAGYGLARRLNRAIVRLCLPIHDATGRLSEVAGPITLPAGWGLDELESALGVLAGQVDAVVDRLQQSQREALRAEQLAAVGQLAAGFAHEVRNPLMAMKILVQAAAECPAGAGLAGRPLAVLEEEIGRLEGLTATFLDFARPPRVRTEPVDLHEVIEDVVGLLAWRAGQRDVTLAVTPAAAPPVVAADPDQVRQLLLNLLLNGIEAVPDGGVVCVQVCPAVDGRVVIEVADDGHGLPADLGQAIFSPFVTTKPAGLGLGLSICQRIAERHGGTITAADRPGGGAVFWVGLPRGDRA